MRILITITFLVYFVAIEAQNPFPARRSGAQWDLNGHRELPHAGDLTVEKSSARDSDSTTIVSKIRAQIRLEESHRYRTLALMEDYYSFRRRMHQGPFADTDALLSNDAPPPKDHGVPRDGPPHITLTGNRSQPLVEDLRLDRFDCSRCTRSAVDSGMYVANTIWTSKLTEGPILTIEVQEDVPDTFDYFQIKYRAAYFIDARYFHVRPSLVVEYDGMLDTLIEKFVPFLNTITGYIRFNVRGYDRIVSFELHEIQQYTPDISTDRMNFNVYGLEWAKGTLQPPAYGKPADFYINDRIAHATAGDTVDFTGDTLLLRGTVHCDTDSISIRNLTVYMDKGRYFNSTRETDAFKVTRGKEILLENINVYGIREPENYGAGLDGGLLKISSVVSPYHYRPYISRHFEPGRGLVYRIDVAGRGSGNFSIIEHETGTVLTSQDLSLSAGDTVSVYFRLTDILNTVDFTTSFDELDLMVWNHVYHHYPSEFAAGIKIGGSATRITCRNWHVETVMGDGFQIDGRAEDCLLENFLVNGANRQGGSVNGAINTTIRNAELYNTGRSGLDVEPYALHDTVWGLNVYDMITGNHKFSAWISNNWTRVLDLYVNGFTAVGQLDIAWKGGTRNGTIRNVTLNDNFSYQGAHTTIENLTVDGTINVDGGTLGNRFDTLKTGYVTVRNFRMERRDGSSNYLLATGDSTNTFINGVLSDSLYDNEINTALPLAYLAGEGILQNVIVEDFERLYPNSVIHDDRTPVLPTDPSVSIRPETRFSFADARGTMSPATRYYYQLGVVIGRDTVWTPETSVVLSNKATAIGISLKDVADPINGYVYNHFVIRRGTATGNYDIQFAVRPDTRASGFRYLSGFQDFGGFLHFRGGNATNFRFFGYGKVLQDSYVVISGNPL